MSYSSLTYRPLLLHSGILCCGMLILLACGKKETKTNQLVFWSSTNPEEMTFTKKYIDQWNAAHPDQPVAFQPVPEGQSSEEVILAAVVGRTTPDLYANMWQGDVEDFARSGVLIPLDTLDGFLEFLYARCDSATIQEITSVDGHIYQVPWKVNPVMMMYNQKLLEENGVDSVPDTYSEFLQAGEKLKQNGVRLGSSEVNAIWWQRFFNFLPLYYAISGGASLVKNGNATFDNAHARNVFTFLQQVYTNEYFPQEQLKAQRDPFLAGQIAITFTGPWTIQFNEKFKPEGFDYSFAPMPVPDHHTGTLYTYGDPKNIVMFNTCQHPQRAWDLLQTMLTAEADFDLVQISKQFPRRKDMHLIEGYAAFLEQNPKLQPFAVQASSVRGMDMQPYMKEVLDLISQEYEACVVFGLKTPDEAIADAAKAVNLLYLE